MTYRCELSTQQYQIYFSFLTNSLLANARMISIRILNDKYADWEFRVTEKPFFPNSFYSFQSDLLTAHQPFLTVDRTDFPLDIEVTLWVDRLDDPGHYVPGYNTPIVSSIQAPRFSDSDIGPLPMLVPVLIHYNNGRLSVAQ